MLLKSASTPLLNSWIPHSKELSSKPESSPLISRTRFVSLKVSSSSDESNRRRTTAVSETDLRMTSSPVVPKMGIVKQNSGILNQVFVEEEEEVEKEEARFQWRRTASVAVEEECGIGGGDGGGSDTGDNEWSLWDRTTKMMVRQDFVKAENTVGELYWKIQMTGMFIHLQASYAHFLWDAEEEDEEEQEQVVLAIDFFVDRRSILRSSMYVCFGSLATPLSSQKRIVGQRSTIDGYWITMDDRLQI
ncbi:hypothetical protein GQ457_05G004540 [Hibiscus cannabinus]